MIIMSVYLDNIFSFNKFETDFSYPRKIKNSNIEEEWLEDRENFRYKKLNIIMGANASGKTTLGIALSYIYNFLFKKEKSIEIFLDKIKDSNKVATFKIQFADPVKKHFLDIECKFLKDEITEFNFKVKNILTNESYERVIESINKKTALLKDFSYKKKKGEDKVALFELFSNLEYISDEYSPDWLFINPKNNIFNIKKESVNILEKVLKALDSNIESVTPIENVGEENLYGIFFKDGFRAVVIQNGKIVDESPLSSGTKEGIHIGNALYNIITDKKNNQNRVYYIDEKFAYIHTELEKKLLSTIIDFLPRNSQLFFTTHNSDILDFNVPMHSYTFLKKENNIEAIHPEKVIKKNDRNLKAYVENDVFNTQPSTKFINELLDEYLD